MKQHHLRNQLVLVVGQEEQLWQLAFAAGKLEFWIENRNQNINFKNGQMY